MKVVRDEAENQVHEATVIPAQGTIERAYMSPLVKSILVENGLNFEIEKEPMQGAVSGRPSSYFGLYNSVTNECIGTCKAGYHISQNFEVVDLVLRGTEIFGDEISVTKAGSINGGRKIFIQLKIKGISKVSNDIVERFITIIDSNDGSTSLSVGIGDLTLSCQNQFYKFYKAGEAKFRHSASLAEKLKSLPFLIETALKESHKQVDIYNKLADFQIDESKKHYMVKAMLGHDRKITSPDNYAKLSSRSLNIMDKVYNHINKEMEDKGNNLWGLHSGITSFTTHDASAPSRDNGRFESLVRGKNYDMNQASLQYVMRESGLFEVA